MPINNGICSECNHKYTRALIFSDKPSYFVEKLEKLNSPIVFKDKKHLFKNCSEFELDKELDVASKTTEWHICRLQEVVCERIYDKDEEYCAKHNKQCLKCRTQEGVNSEFYCFAHAEICQKCSTRISSDGYCTPCQEQYLRCQSLVKPPYYTSNDRDRKKCLQSTKIGEEQYCSQHKFACQQLYCLNRMEDKRDGYCPDHRDNCQLDSCSGRLLKWSEKFCSQHLKQWKCSRCGEESEGRFEGQGEVAGHCWKGKDIWEYDHKWECFGIIEDGLLLKCCLICSNTVSSSNQYCWKHLYPCLECKNGRSADYNSYCSSYCEEKKLKQLIQQSKKIPGKITDLERFKTWWSKENVATIITN